MIPVLTSSTGSADQEMILASSSSTGSADQLSSAAARPHVYSRETVQQTAIPTLWWMAVITTMTSGFPSRRTGSFHFVLPFSILDVSFFFSLARLFFIADRLSILFYFFFFFVIQRDTFCYIRSLILFTSKFMKTGHT